MEFVPSMGRNGPVLFQNQHKYRTKGVKNILIWNKPANILRVGYITCLSIRRGWFKFLWKGHWVAEQGNILDPVQTSNAWKINVLELLQSSSYAIGIAGGYDGTSSAISQASSYSMIIWNCQNVNSFNSARKPLLCNLSSLKLFLFIGSSFQMLLETWI